MYVAIVTKGPERAVVAVLGPFSTHDAATKFVWETYGQRDEVTGEFVDGPLNREQQLECTVKWLQLPL